MKTNLNARNNSVMNVASLAIVAVFVLMASILATSPEKISLDHFDDPSTPAASPQASDANQRIQRVIARQQEMLLIYAAKIKSASAKVDAAMQDVATNGDNPVRAAVLASQRRQLQLLQASFAPQIQSAERSIAEMRAQLDSMSARAKKTDSSPDGEYAQAVSTATLQATR
jgi:DNA-binding ferritin-like protein